jgi:surfeit locus 1 family protein
VKRFAGLIVGVVAAVVFARLGVWQLDRRAERRDRNALLEARLSQPPIHLTEAGPLLTAAADSLRFRRVRAVGRFDFLYEAVQGGLSYNGAPGVHLMTPLRLADGAGVLVDRGWTYAADGMTANRDSLREPDSTVVEGVFVAPVARWGVRPDTLDAGYPMLRPILRRTEGPSGLPTGLAVPPLPALDDGPHLAYALQWFSFAVIAVVGGALLSRRPKTRAH